MFEDALMESGGRIKSKSKYWSIVAFAINAGILIGLILYPLFHLESLPKQMMATLLTAPAPPPPPPPPPPPAAPVPKIKVQTVDPFQAPSKIPHEIKVVKEEPPPPPPGGVAGMEGMAGGSGGGAIGGILGGMGPSAPVVKAAAPKKIAISSGVMAGNKLSGTNPTYPPIARAARISGTVVLQATISKSGSIENLRVVSGPPMLTQSAMDAVRTWRYKPYQLNGEPVEVETTVNVVFNLGG
jgi:protein TonB